MELFYSYDGDVVFWIYDVRVWLFDVVFWKHWKSMCAVAVESIVISILARYNSQMVSSIAVYVTLPICF